MVTWSPAFVLVLAVGCGSPGLLGGCTETPTGAQSAAAGCAEADALDLLGPARAPEPRSPPAYPLWTPGPPRPGEVGPCSPALRVETWKDHVVVSSSVETSRPVIDHGWALLYDGAACSLWGAHPVGEPTRIPVALTASRIQAEGEGVLVADGYSTPRVVERLRGAARQSSWQIGVSEHLALDSFHFTDSVVGFVDLDLDAPDIWQATHVFWIADPAGTALGRIELGGYLAVRGRPFCRAGRCVAVGELRHLGDHAEHAWMLGVEGQAEDQALSTGPVYAAMTVEAGGVLYDFFLQADSLYAARWKEGRWEGLGRLDGVVGFQAVADGDTPILAWVQAGRSGGTPGSSSGYPARCRSWPGPPPRIRSCSSRPPLAWTSRSCGATSAMSTGPSRGTSG